MLVLSRRSSIRLLSGVLGFVAIGFTAFEPSAFGQVKQATALESRTSRTATFLPTRPQSSTAESQPDKVATGHPLAAIIDYARSEQKYLAQTLRDFSCRLVKRERINGFVQEMTYIDMNVREEVLDGDQTVQPLSIFLRFLGPSKIAGRTALFIEGQNDNKILVRNGGRHFDYVVVKVDPNSDTDKEETLVPITEIGFNRLLDKMIDVLERHQKADPTGANTKVERVAGAKMNHRPCTVIRVTHPAHMPGLEFHIANVFVDDELHAPVRVDYSDWAKSPGGKLPLIAEYTYTNLKLNVELPDAAFSRAQLRSAAE